MTLTFQQAFEIPQTPGAMMGGNPGGLFQFGRGMLFSQLQQALHHAQALGGAGLMHRFSPRAGQGTNQTAAIQQIVRAPFDDVAFAAVQMGGIGGELSRFGQRM